MKQKECVIPAECLGCGATFDLWSDLVLYSHIKTQFDDSLCIHCRNELKREEREFIYNSAGSIDDEYKLVDEIVGGDYASNMLNS